jgi:hypothetical protein
MTDKKKPAATIDGVPCTIESRRIQDAIRQVFAAIQRHPRDWARLRRRVQRVSWLPTEKERTAVGWWILDDDDVRRLNAQVTPDTPRRWWRQGEGDWFARGWIGLSRPLTARLSAEHLVALVAHECGHAVARMRDFHVRDGLDAEWANEACADRLAFRWGFEREIRAETPPPGASATTAPCPAKWCGSTTKPSASTGTSSFARVHGLTVRHRRRRNERIVGVVRSTRSAARSPRPTQARWRP